ncbi:hypothetical protein C8J55DRAFT_493625 [Lentinula edodes]|uniref:Uncharacterized protein n=1 Tax=Lentinula lateritia TaxID=40482 RepID=A0A9W8ZRG0_9AGAR|nr:hypothetical protein C8J55DRAFT_493625 [Lentinula edodes]
MRILFTVFAFATLLLLERTFASPLIAKRMPEAHSNNLVFIGYRFMFLNLQKRTATIYNKKNTLVYTTREYTQLGKGAYLTRRLGDWVEDYVCAVYADAAKLAPAKKERESPVREEVIKTKLKMKEESIHKVILVSGIWGSNDRYSEVQMLIPPYLLADKHSIGKLGIYVTCVPWDNRAELPTNEDADWGSLSIVGY